MSEPEFVYRAVNRGQYGVVGIPVRNSETVLHVRAGVIGPWPSPENRERLHTALHDILAYGGATTTSRERAAQERLLEPAFRMWQCIMDSAAVQADAVRGKEIRFERGMTAASREWFEPADRVSFPEAEAFRNATAVLHDLILRAGTLSREDFANARELLGTGAAEGAPDREGLA